MHTNHFHFPAISISSERRLCHLGEQTPERAYETYTSTDAMNKNESIKEMRLQFDNLYTRAEYPEMNGDNVLDRAYFQAMLLDSAIADGKEYKEIKREDLNVADPLGLMAMASDLDRGRWLTANLPLDLLKSLDDTLEEITDKKDITEASQLERLGQIYRDKVILSSEEWIKKGAISDPVVRRVPLERYRVISNDVDKVLEDNGIRVPHIESDLSTMGDTNLTRREYLTLLSLVWKGSVTVEEIAAASASGTAAIRTLLGVNESVVAGVQRRFVDISLEELGPSEMLSGLNVEITPDLRRSYVRAATGKDPDFARVVPGSDAEKMMPERVVTLAADQTAGTWNRYPERAYPFLATYMGAPGSSNPDFLRSLEYYFVLTPEQRMGMEPPPLDEKDTRAVLNLVSQSLVEAETVMRESSNQKTELRNALSFAEKAENTFGNVWEYMKDVRSHPVGSAMMWGVAIVAGMKLWKFAKGEHKNFTQWVMGAGLVGAAVGLYQQHSGGNAWWESLGEKMNDWMGREKSKEAGEGTLANYWTDRLDRKSDRERVTMTILGDQKIGSVLDWYGQMSQWKAGGSEGVPPVSQIRADAKLRRYFGSNTTSRERDVMIYDTLNAFFEDRGRAIEKEIPDYNSTIPRGDHAALGYAYIKDRYLEQVFFKSTVDGMIVIGDIKIEGRTITEWDPENPELKRIEKTRPDVFLKLKEIHKGYLEEVRHRRTGEWDMNSIFLLEANPEILRRMGREGTEAAGMLDTLKDGIKGLSDKVTVAGPEERAEKTKLFTGAEAALFDSLHGTHLVREVPRAKSADEIVSEWVAYVDTLPLPDVAKEAMKTVISGAAALRSPDELVKLSERTRFEYTVIADWNEFTQRLPADTATAERLRDYMAAYVAANRSTATLNLFNDIESKKYQLLIAASNVESRLNLVNVEHLNPVEDKTWNAMFDNIADFVMFDDAKYPTVDSFYALRTLFDSEAEQKGGVVWYDVLHRMFPAWEKSHFHVLGEQIERYEHAFARLRVLPVIRPGVVLTPEEINGLEKQLAQRMANRTLEAMLLTHGRSVPDSAGDRTVSIVEQGNLENYYEDLFVELMGCKAGAIHPKVELPSTLENMNSYVWNQLPGDIVRVTDSATSTFKDYVWDPVKEYWVEIGIPYTKERLAELNIFVGENITLADEKVREFIDYVKPKLKAMGNSTMSMMEEGGKVTVEWLSATGETIKRFTMDSVEGAKIIVDSGVVESEGVPESVSLAFVQKRHDIRAIDSRLFAQPISDGNKVEVGLLSSSMWNSSMGLVPAVNYDLYQPLTMTLGEFLDAANSPNKLVDDWLQKAMIEKDKELASLPIGYTGLAIEMRFIAGSHDLEFSAGFVDPKYTARASAFEFMGQPVGKIYEAYQRWKDLVQSGSTMEKNPFKI